MSRLILGHVPGDEDAAQHITALLELPGVVTIPVTPESRPLILGADVILGLIWSARADGASLARFAGDGRNAFVICADNSAVDPILSRLVMMQVGPNASMQDIANVMKIARLARPRGVRASDRSASPRPANAAYAAAGSGEANYGRMFVSGLTRGLASSFAVMSLGGGMTVAIQETAGAMNVSSANDEQAPASPMRVAVRSAPGLVSDTQLLIEANALRTAEAEQHAQVGQMLEIAGDRLADARARTDRIMVRLKQIADTPDAPQAGQVAQASHFIELNARAPQIEKIADLRDELKLSADLPDDPAHS